MNHTNLPKWLTSAALAVSLLTTSSSAFTDTEGHWAEKAIDKWSEEYSIINGYKDGTFRPDESITRGAFAGILDRFLKFQSISLPDVFSDIEGHYWEESILKLNAAGVYLGNQGQALAGASITRQQAVAMIGRAFQIETFATELPYTDADQIADYARPYIAEMTELGYLNDSTDGRYRPTDPITRAELIHILDNMIQVLIGNLEAYSQNVDGTVMINSAEGAILSDMTISGDLILAPGVQNQVTLQDVTIEGTLRNFSSVTPVILTTTPPDSNEEDEDDEKGDEETEENDDPVADDEEDVEPGDSHVLRPEDIYTPGETTGDVLLYGGNSIPIYDNVEKSRLYNGDFYWNGDRLEYIGSDFETRFGIDISAYQNRASENGVIDWEAVAADGVDFVMVRIGYRGTSTGLVYADQYYLENIKGAMAAGIETGVYFFAQAITIEEAIEEAEFVLDLLEQNDIVLDGPVAYDWEMHDASYRVYGTAPEMATACAIAFCQRIEEAGYTPMIYAGQYVSYMKYDQGAIAPYLSWYPEYKSSSSQALYPAFYYQMDYWQFSSSCTVDGIGGKVDANIQFISR